MSTTSFATPTLSDSVTSYNRKTVSPFNINTMREADMTEQPTLEKALASLVGEELRKKDQPFFKKTQPMHIRSEDVLPAVDHDDVKIRPQGSIPKGVDRFIEVISHEHDETIKRCLEIAEQLERTSEELRRRAAILVNQQKNIPEDIRRAVLYERESLDFARSCRFVGAMKDESKPQDPV